MSQSNDGGPAFPVARIAYSNDTTEGVPLTGMSLRDWFAGMAMQKVMDFEVTEKEAESESLALVVARTAYQMADAMLKERSKEST